MKEDTLCVPNAGPFGRVACFAGWWRFGPLPHKFPFLHSNSLSCTTKLTTWETFPRNLIEKVSLKSFHTTKLTTNEKLLQETWLKKFHLKFPSLHCWNFPKKLYWKSFTHKFLSLHCWLCCTTKLTTWETFPRNLIEKVSLKSFHATKLTTNEKLSQET